MRRLLALALGVMVGLGAAPAGAAETPASLETTFGESVPAATRWYVEEALERSWARFAAVLDDLDAEVVVVADAEAASAAWAERRGISRERASRLFTARSGHYAGLATTGLTVIINDAAHAGATVHEFVHLVQHALCDCGNQGPRWISEGAAEYFALDVEAAWGIDASSRPPAATNREIADAWAATYRNCRTGRLQEGSDTCRWATESLRALEGAGQFDLAGGAVGAYDRASVAFQYLVDVSSEEAYLCFLDEQAGGASWQAAFGGCFERSVDDFYTEFDGYRRRGFVREGRTRLHALA